MDEPDAPAKAGVPSDASRAPDSETQIVPPIDPLEREKFEFEKEQKLAEAARLSEELKIKQGESKRSRWTNPLLVAIIGATAVGLGNVAVSVLNAKYQRDLAETTNQNLGYLESVKSENTSVLEIVKLADADKVRAGLCLLLKLNSIKSSTTNAAIQAYLLEHKGCPTLASSTDPNVSSANRSDWITASLVVPGCGTSGCYQNFNVCGSAPTNTKPTGTIRNSVDSFGGAWGDWSGPPTVTATQVCRTFTQHSHNVTRTVSFQFEVVPIS